MFVVTGQDNYRQEIAYASFTDGAYTLTDLVPGVYRVTEEHAQISGLKLTTTYSVLFGSTVVTGNSTAEVAVTNTYTPDLLPDIGGDKTGTTDKTSTISGSKTSTGGSVGGSSGGGGYSVGGDGTPSPKTGDETPIALWLVIMLGALLAMGFVLKRRKSISNDQ